MENLPNQIKINNTIIITNYPNFYGKNFLSLEPNNPEGNINIINNNQNRFPIYINEKNPFGPNINIVNNYYDK